jgi:hypothetical protein
MFEKSSLIVLFIQVVLAKYQFLPLQDWELPGSAFMFVHYDVIIMSACIAK